MKKIKLLKWLLPILLQFCSVPTNAQLNIAEYFFDIDPGIGNGFSLNSLNINSGMQYDATTFSGNIIVPNNTQPGYHNVYIRFADVDSNGNKKWSQCEAKKVYINSSGTTITKAEYFFDTDPGVGNATGIPLNGNADSSSFTGNIMTTGLISGFHNLYIRAQDGEGKWSNYETKKLYVLTSGISITQAEYFYDVDPGLGNGIAITLPGNTDSSSFTGNLNTNNLPIGFHNVYIRVKKITGEWSHYETKKLFVLSTGVSISKAEYFFDNDPGLGNGIPISITGNADSSIFAGNLNTASLTPGYHQACIRTQSTSGLWSVYEVRRFEILFQGNAIPKAEYFVDTDPGVGNGININLTALNNHESEFIGGITFDSTLSAGYHSLYFRVVDHQGNWGHIDTALTFFNCKVPDLPTITSTSPSNCGIANITLSITSGSLHSAGHWAWYQGSCNGQLVDTGNSIVVTPFDTTSYFVRGEGGGCFNYGNCANTIINANPSSTLKLTLLLEGYYESNGKMKAVLNNQGVNNNLNITDSILVELHDTATNALVAEKKILLLTNGNAISNFCPLQGTFNVAIKHRNSIETWSANPIILSNQLGSLDFTVSDTNAYGNNMLEVDPGIWAFYSGDINSDENIDLLDLSSVEADINDFQFGYFATDINGDGNVDLLDAAPVEANINGFIFSVHP